MGVSPRFRTRGPVRGLVAAAAAALVLTAATGCGARVAGKAVEAAGDTASPSPTGSGSTGGGSKPTGSPSPTKPRLVPTDAEAISLLKALDVSPKTASGELDEAEAAKRLAEPMLSVVKASWRIAKPSFRISGGMPTPYQPRVYRPAPSANGDRWFVIADGEPDLSEDRFIYVFRATAADPAWKLAMTTILVENQPFPGIDEDASGLAQVVASPSGLATDPAAVCAQLAQPEKQRGVTWGPNQSKADRQVAELIAQQARQSVSAKVAREVRPEAVGPVWRTPTGGAMVPCVLTNKWTNTVVDGRPPMEWNGKSRYKAETPGFRVTSFVDTNIGMSLVWIPPAAGAAATTPDVAADVVYPLDFTYQKAKS
ncbi:hypothetical protein ACPA54_30900 [Uniformispora flossi]|uniref:hypothetical protein n=1 Tax=Uniformispora flossi TaxID=3390723 RepID=UPI003C2C391A